MYMPILSSFRSSFCLLINPKESVTSFAAAHCQKVCLRLQNLQQNRPCVKTFRCRSDTSHIYSFVIAQFQPVLFYLVNELHFFRVGLLMILRVDLQCSVFTFPQTIFKNNFGASTLGIALQKIE